MKTKTKFEIAVLGIIIMAIGYIAFSSKPQQVEAQRTVVIDGDLYTVSNLYSSGRLTNSKDIRILFEEKNGKMLIGKGLEGYEPNTEAVGSTTLYLYTQDAQIKVSDEANVNYAIFDKNAENIIYDTIDANLYQYNIKNGKNEKIAKAALSPRLSPDGKSLLYEKVRVLLGSETFNELDGIPGFAILNLENKKEKMIPNTNSSHSGSPQWTPDGNQVIINSDCMYMINIDGTERTQLTKQGDGVCVAVGDISIWSSDGRFMIYEGNDNTVVLFELDLKNKRIITGGPIAYGVGPKWVEEGKTFSVFSPDAKVGAPALSVIDLNGKVLSGDKSHEKDYYSSSKGAFRRIAPRPVPPPTPVPQGGEIQLKTFTPSTEDASIPNSIQKANPAEVPTLSPQQ